MKNSLKITLISGAVISCCAFYMYGIPALINISSHKAFIEEKVFETSGYKIDIGNPDMSMGRFPSIWIKSDKISLLNADNSVALSVVNPKLKLKLFPLLRKKIDISHLTADREIINFVYSKDSKFKLGQYDINLPETEGEYVLSKMGLNLGEYFISLKDEQRNSEMHLNGEYFEHGKYVRNKRLRFGTRAVFLKDGKSTPVFVDADIRLPIDRLSENTFNVEADIDNFDLSQISDYTNTLTKGLVKSAKGFISFNASTSKDDFGHKKTNIAISTNGLEILGKDQGSSIIFKDNLVSDIDFSTVNNGILFNNIGLKAKRIDFTAHGKVYDIGKKEPKYDIEAEVKDTRIEDVTAILPGSETLLPDFNLYRLKKYVFYGNGKGKLHFKGHGIYPDVRGSIKLWDCYLMHTIKGAYANADVSLKFNGNNMDVDVFVPAGKDQTVSVRGNALIDGSKYSELNIESTDSVALAPAQEILNPLHEILKFQLGPVPIMKASGYGNIKLRSAGRKIDPHIWGKINFRNATASFNDIHNMELINGSGEVVFDDTDVTFQTFSGTINGRPVKIKGECSVLGKLNVFAETNGQDIKQVIKIINSSPVLSEVQKVIKPFTKPDGIADVFLNIYGTAKNAEELVFNKDLFSKGKITLHNATTQLQNTHLPFKKVEGVVNFDKYNCDYDIKGLLRGSPLHVWGTGTNNVIDLKANSQDLEIADIFDLLHPDMSLPYKNEIGRLHASVDGAYKGAVVNNNIDYKKIVAEGKFMNNMSSNNPVRLDGGTFTMQNGFLSTSDLNGYFYNNSFGLNFTAKDLDKENFAVSDAKFDFKNFDISSVNTIKNQIKLSPSTKKLFNDISDIKGRTDVRGTIKNNSINASADLKNTSFVYGPLSSNVHILEGFTTINGNVLYLDKIKANVSGMPVGVEGRIGNIYSQNPALNLSLSAIPNQTFIDRAFNAKSVYPLKAKGDIALNARLTGTLNAIAAKSILRLGENSSIYYMGATVSGNENEIEDKLVITNPVSVVSDLVLSPDRIKINSFNFGETVQKAYNNFVSASGELLLSKNKLSGFKNFKIKTSNPTDARLFNILFRKPTIKQGTFASNIVINGSSVYPSASGLLSLNDVNIPLFDSTLQDINLDFQKDYVYLNASGVILTNKLVASAKLINSSKPPYVVEDLKIQAEGLDLNILSSSLSDLEADYTRTSKLKTDSAIQPFSPEMIVIRNGEITADKILIKKANASDFKSHLTINDKHEVDIDNYSFDIANGSVFGDIKYNLSTFDGAATMAINNTDAGIIAENFFDMPGQMYGTVTGSMNMKFKGINSVECVSTLSGEGEFEVIDGKMPKLGSLEYLLKAGNLITSGVTGVSINSIIDLITPLKTGSFSSIKGYVHVDNGIADDINVYSSGKDLNLYLTGSYNLMTLVADMDVYGSLSKDFSTLLGRIANSSLNTLFNTIPGVKINEINPASSSNINKIPNFDKNNVLRVFKAEIYGDINGNNYVKSFKWIKD